jgi:hypothetical protein
MAKNYNPTTRIVATKAPRNNLECIIKKTTLSLEIFCFQLKLSDVMGDCRVLLLFISVLAGDPIIIFV